MLNDLPRFIRFMPLLMAVAILSATVSHAEEGGSGHYFQGSMSSFVDGAPAEPVFITRFNYAYYDGQVSVNREIPIAGLLAANVRATSTAMALTMLWAPEWGAPER